MSRRPLHLLIPRKLGLKKEISDSDVSMDDSLEQSEDAGYL
jgi:hypothetical protein